MEISMADNSMFQLQIISPDRVFYQGDISMVELKTTEGDIGILKDHIPLTAVVAPGIVTITEGQNKRYAAVHSGFLEITKNKVTVLAEVCEWPEEIDINRAEEAKIRAERRLRSHEDNLNELRAEMALRRSLTRIELVQKAKQD